MKLTFLGAAGTVTGSKFLLETDSANILIDCGLFQGLKHLRVRNWHKMALNPQNLDAIILTHAHIDHSGYIPRLISEGFREKIYCTPVTRDLCKLLLPDSGYIQEEDAKYANRKGYSKHHPAEPLYTQKEAIASLDYFRPVVFNKDFKIGKVRFRFVPAGHILGAASIIIQAEGKTVLFSGDLGRSNDAVIPAPTPPNGADWIIMESTYGDRPHAQVDRMEFLTRVLKRIVERKGILLVPSFAVGRAQLLLFYFYRLFQKHPELKIPTYVNSPMATDVSKLYYIYPDRHLISDEETREMFEMAHFVHSVEESKSLNHRKGPAIIISASGMLTGGRILHHVKNLAPDSRNAILLAGFQAPGTRGAALAHGAKEIKIHGTEVPVKAEVLELDVSAHAGQNELVDWIQQTKKTPRHVYLVHGEPEAADALRQRIEEELHMRVSVAEDGETVEM